jgi:hypothetical protein
MDEDDVLAALLAEQDFAPGPSTAGDGSKAPASLDEFDFESLDS